MKSKNWTIQLSNPTNTDLNLFSQFCKERFDETYCYTLEDLESFFQTYYTPDVLKSEMENTDLYLYYIAYSNDNMIGFLQLQFHHTKKYECIPLEKTIEISRLYITKEYFGTGLAQELMSIVFKQGFDGVWLGVWENNFRAQKFYQKCGFERIGEHQFVVGQKVDCDYLFFKKL